MHPKCYLLLFSLLVPLSIQAGNIKGQVYADDLPLAFANIALANTSYGTVSDDKGYFVLDNIPEGEYKMIVSSIGYESYSQSILIYKDESINIKLELKSNSTLLNAVTITGTKTFKRRTDSPVMVNIVDSKTMDNVQACNLSEGLKFQPGLRVETDCQTCNYTQLRINGLGGSYSQILINGRPIFSPLTGLYGLEQLPTNMIERIEVVRGGGSSLYGSSAIAGTVNVITKIPKKNTYEFNYFYQNIAQQTNDHHLRANTTFVHKNKNLGASLFGNYRNRGYYDHNKDNFSEIPAIENIALGTNLFYLPKENQKLEVSLSYLNEYRHGGEILIDKTVHLTAQAEEREHNVWLGSADYQLNFNEDNSTFISYMAWQNTQRTHYTGIFPDTAEDIEIHLQNPPYGISNTTTLQGGFQLNHRLDNFLKGSNVLTLGSEYIQDDVFDNIDAYNYNIDQISKTLGVFLQSDWNISPSLSLLSGIRLDKHNLVDNPILNTRLSLLYKFKKNTQFRLNYGTGFRAPQAFDTDLHIAFAGGGISRVQLSPDLLEEHSQSLSSSINYDKATDDYVFGFTLEGFYTHLKNAFYMHPLGEDAFGEVFEKRNGAGAAVKGATLELRGNYKQKIQLETGLTLQRSQYEDPVSYIESVSPTRNFLRTPNQYGFANLLLMPNQRLNINLNYVYTGKMEVLHLAGAPNQSVDEIITSAPFSEVNLKTSYLFPIQNIKTGIELYGGVKNIFNAYQNDFDIGKNRDSNYIYGSAAPRTFFVGVKFKSI